MKEKKAVSHIWDDTGTEKKQNSLCRVESKKS